MLMTLKVSQRHGYQRDPRVADDAIAQALREGHVRTTYMVRNVITASLEMMRGDSAQAMPASASRTDKR